VSVSFASSLPRERLRFAYNTRCQRLKGGILGVAVPRGREQVVYDDDVAILLHDRRCIVFPTHRH
jgi:hypothetical protein